MRHWTEHNIRELVDTLADIEETVLIYPSTGGRHRSC
jgi:protein tyrosine phosphatase (PTP) superfamily phosphohydrolase (DUF442 family)